MKTLVWHGCYDEAWKGVIPDAAFEHPAKFSKRLVERIIEHMEARGWLVKEERPVIADPFAGVRLGGVIAAYRGYQWVGVELEQRFIDLGDSVCHLHRDRWTRLGVPAPICVKGDSRRFDELIREAADAVVSSPPYVSGGHHMDVFDAWNNNGGGQNAQPQAYGKTYGQISQLKEGEVSAVVSSPPFLRSHGGERGIMVDGLHTADGRVHKGFKERQYRDGERDAANIEATGHGDVDAVISSPPYDDIAAGAGGLNSKPPTRAGQQAGRRKGPSQSGDQRYGKTEGQISRARKGSVGAVLTSPPYEDSLRSKEHGFDFTKAKPDYLGRVEHPERVAQHSKAHDNRRYGDEPGQIGKLKKQTYWEAMLEVYSATFRALKPGGVMAIVVKDFVKDGRRQRLCDDTLKLLQHIGFEGLERVRAMLVKHYDHGDLFTGTSRTTKTRKSFFRRHLEKDLSPRSHRRINWEEVLFVRKPIAVDHECLECDYELRTGVGAPVQHHCDR